MLNKKTITVIGVLLAANTSVAKEKNYEIIDLTLVVSNSKSCNSLYYEIKEATKDTVKLEFNEAEEVGKFSVDDDDNKLVNHTHNIVKQKIDGMIYRVGAGEFYLNKKIIDYVIITSADIENADYKYSYPMILTAENGNCHYTALVEPSIGTIESFKENIESGLVKDKKDLSAN